MTIVGMHRGAVSGKVHVHLLRESAAERAARAAARRNAEEDHPGSETSAANRPAGTSTNPQRRAG